MAQRGDSLEIRTGSCCHITHEIVIEGRTAFARDEKVFVEDVVIDPEGARRYTVMSKTLSFRRFQLSEVDLSLSHVHGSRPRVKTFPERLAARHKVAVPVVTAVVLLATAGAIMFLLYGFVWNATFDGAGSKVLRARAAPDGTVFAIGVKDSRSLLLESRGRLFAPVASGDEAFNDVTAAGSESAWIVTSLGRIYHYDGSSLELQHDTLTQTWMGAISDELTAVFALDASHVWAVGTYRKHSAVPGYIPTTSGAIYFYNGSSWSLSATLPPGSELIDVAAADPAHVWAASHQGGIFFYDGQKWALQVKTRENITAICAADARHVWAVTDSSRDSTGKVLAFDGTAWALSTRVSKMSFADVCADRGKEVRAVGRDSVAYVAQQQALAQNSKAKLPAQPDAVWVWDGKSWSSMAGPPGSDDCTSICTGPEGRLWVVARGRIYFGENGF